MSPEGKFDKAAQIKSLDSRILYMVNQGVLPLGEAVDEQLKDKFGLKPSDLDYVLLTHLDCDHANSLKLVKDAKNIMVSREELKCAHKYRFLRYRSAWWEGVNLKEIDWNGNEGPVGKSCDLFGDGSIVLINIPGHADGLIAVKISNEEGKFVLLVGDGGYAEKSWTEMILIWCCTRSKGTKGLAALDKSSKRGSKLREGASYPRY